MPFVKPENVYDSSIYEDGVYDGICDHIPVELILYCRLYDSIALPPSLSGALQLRYIMPLSEEPSPYKSVGGSGMVDGVAEFVICVEFVGCDEYEP